ncbi:MAG: tetratricopeptide repeat protein [Deltaproteobacteria bacterium]|nr:tetratricopeptide repeat protein [Deltaproteobacteria bacterium]
MLTSELFSTALAYLQSGNIQKAKSLFYRILERTPEHADTLHLLGIIAQREGQCAIAANLIRKAVDVCPNGRMHCSLGNAYNSLGDYLAAEDNYRTAILLEPDNEEAHAKLGILLQVQGKVNEAIECFRTAIKLKPFAETYSNLGCALKDIGEYAAAVENFEKSLSIKPDYPRTYSNLLFCLSHMELVSPEELFAGHCRFGNYFGNLPTYSFGRQVAQEPQRRLRLGFISGDLWNHAVAYFLEPLWADLDPEQIEIWVYYNYHVEDSVTERLKSLANRWRSVFNMSDEALAAEIHSDSIDILFDLSGHTARNRLLVFARKPAPIQVSWLGYPGTSGLKAMDYFIADHSLAPKGLLDDFFTEKIVRLPSAVSFEPFPHSPPVKPLPAMKNGYFTFGSFHRTAKLGEGVISLWCRVLNSVPRSRMLLGNASEQRRIVLLERFKQYGISEERLDFHPCVPMYEYLELHNNVDLILDTFPYAGGTTTAHAAWMGVPVLTMSGKTMPSLQGAAMMNQIGIPGFVTDSPAMFLEQALGWTNKIHELAVIRSGLRERMLDLPLMKQKILNRAFERAVRIMWCRRCDGLEPASFDVVLPQT